MKKKRKKSINKGRKGERNQDGKGRKKERKRSRKKEVKQELAERTKENKCNHEKIVHYLQYKVYDSKILEDPLSSPLMSSTQEYIYIFI